jgi:hypothetical protein
MYDMYLGSVRANIYTYVVLIRPLPNITYQAQAYQNTCRVPVVRDWIREASLKGGNQQKDRTQSFITVIN